MEMQTYYNPVVSGYYPDPSVVRVDEDFYMVNSSFEFFPGVPLLHSKNLVNWEHVGHCLTRKSQLPLENAAVSTGILAPTIRYHKGIYYMITTNLTSLIQRGVGNFIVTATDPLGEWSDPIWIEHEGIDPSLFFDDDNRAYYCGTGFDQNGQAIVLFEIDVKTGKVISEKKSISYGCCGKCPEAPHIYKINGMYYLLLAEGGTEYGHMVTIQRSFNFVRNPEDRFEWDNKNNCLIIDGSDIGLSENLKSPSFVGVRQKDFCGSVKCKIRTDIVNGTKAGMSVYYMHTHHYDIYVTAENNEYRIELNKCIYDFEAVVKSITIKNEELLLKEIILKIDSDENYYTFYYSFDGKEWIEVGKGMTAAMASEATEVTTFTGTYFGMFAQSGKARFNEFAYQWEESAKSERFQTGMVYPD